MNIDKTQVWSQNLTFLAAASCNLTKDWDWNIHIQLRDSKQAKKQQRNNLINDQGYNLVSMAQRLRTQKRNGGINLRHPENKNGTINLRRREHMKRIWDKLHCTPITRPCSSQNYIKDWQRIYAMIVHTISLFTGPLFSISITVFKHAMQKPLSPLTET